ncbi:uncharacterized protein PHACADRAFT_50398, partial [Phanerochaete carnosa HHB-10118-sp]
LRNEDDVTYVGREFMVRKEGREKLMSLVRSAQGRVEHALGDTAHILRDDNWAHLRDAPSDFTRTDVPCIAHVHAVKDEDSPEFWHEITEYLARGVRPVRLQESSQAMRAFLSKTEHFMWKDDRIWRLAKSRLPRLVVMDAARREELVAEAHGVCGHRGRDATY